VARLDAGKSGTFKIGGDIEIIVSASARCASPEKASGVRRKIALRR
jgi:hypothetical protein